VASDLAERELTLTLVSSGCLIALCKKYGVV